MNRTVMIDAGHGGTDPGAVFQGRMEKDDTLQLAFDVGSALERRGIGVEYTRVNDVYDTPYEKAMVGSRSDADLFLSIHRNATAGPGSVSGIMSLVFSADGEAGQHAENINLELERIGWNNLGVVERPGLVVLRKTTMPAVLVEIGFIDNPADNLFLDENMAATADAIADGILETFDRLEYLPPESGETPGYYMVQTGAFRQKENAERMLNELTGRGFETRLAYRDGLYLVRTGGFRNLNQAAALEYQLRHLGYSTYIVRT